MPKPDEPQGTIRTVEDECTLCSRQHRDSSNIATSLITEFTGDVVLHFLDSNAAVDCRYRCSRDLLRQASAYFDVLLDPAKFQEGREVQRKLDALLKAHRNIASLPVDTLPVVLIRDIGDIPAKDNHRHLALRLFLDAIQGAKSGMMILGKALGDSAHALSLAVLLAIIADRFEANQKITSCIHMLNKRLFEDGKKGRVQQRQMEDNKRKRLLIGMLLNKPEWVKRFSASLVCAGSENWTRPARLLADEELQISDQPLWWRLPGGMEGQ